MPELATPGGWLSTTGSAVRVPNHLYQRWEWQNFTGGIAQGSPVSHIPGAWFSLDWTKGRFVICRLAWIC